MRSTVRIGLLFTVWLVMLIAIVNLGYFIPRENFNAILPVFSIAFISLLLFQYWSEENHWAWIFIAGITLRLALFGAVPAWSEDYLRFLWDGELLKLGANPYLYPPADFIQSIENPLSNYLQELVDSMNSLNYYSVYPPLNQAIFYLTSLGAKMDSSQGFMVLRIILILIEIGVFFLIRKLLMMFFIPSNRLIYYWLNPLVILELTGNLHFEGIVLLFLLFAVYFLSKGFLSKSGFFWGISIGMKLLPLMLLPSLLTFDKTQKSFPFWSGALLAFTFSFAWLFIDQSWINFFQSLKLYQGKFEFNASIYYLLREVGFWIKGYNTIATLTKGLSGITLVGIVYFSWKKMPKTNLELVDLWVLIYLIYLVFQPVVHPWYILPALGLSLLTKRKVFLIWSFAAIFSYQAYGNMEYHENPFFLFFEYGLVYFGIYWDYFSPKRNSNLVLGNRA